MAMAAVDDAETDAFQIATLRKARKLLSSVLGRLPEVDAQGGAAGAERSYRVHHEANGHMAVSVRCHPHAPAEARFDLLLRDTWTADIVIRAQGVGTGLLPLFALLREPDLVAEYLPRQAGLPYIERLE